MSWADQSLDRPIVCGHRGAPAVSPENTIASFESAVARGASWVEFDVRPTADGVLVIHHDPDTSEGIDIGTSPRSVLRDDIPEFGDLVAALPSLGLDIEIKVDKIGTDIETYVDLVLREIERHCPAMSNLLVTSFSVPALALVRERRPDLPTGLLFWDRPAKWGLNTAIDGGHVAIGPAHRKVNERFMADARERGLDVLAWTVNKPKDVRRLAALGVDMIVGDDPAVIVDNLV